MRFYYYVSFKSETNMKSFIVIALAVGCALGAQPGLWDDRQCPADNDLESYIIKGEDAPDGKFPYMLSLNYKSSKKHACGASILTKNWALTAAHCCEVKSQFYLYSGSNLLSRGGKEHEIELKKMHEKYDPTKHWRNDICLIKVKDPFVFSDRVKQITLPTQNMAVKDGQLVTITGWGYTQPNTQVIPDKLQIGRNYVALSNENCYKKTNESHESYLCAMGAAKGQGVCNGDSGSPLVIDGVQVGIASWVFLPCGCGLPDFYARVPLFIDWIKQNLGKEASELKFVK